jgi:hypothetical protein
MSEQSGPLAGNAEPQHDGTTGGSPLDGNALADEIEMRLRTAPTYYAPDAKWLLERAAMALRAHTPVAVNPRDLHCADAHPANYTCSECAVAVKQPAQADEIRAMGWAVAVHNDYRLNGEAMTFWLFTKGDRCVKGEGRTDADALAIVLAALSVNPEPAIEQRASESERKNGWTYSWAYMDAIRDKAFVGENEGRPSLETVEGILLAVAALGEEPALTRDEIVAAIDSVSDFGNYTDEIADAVLAALAGKQKETPVSESP